MLSLPKTLQHQHIVLYGSIHWYNIYIFCISWRFTCEVSAVQPHRQYHLLGKYSGCRSHIKAKDAHFLSITRVEKTKEDVVAVNATQAQQWQKRKMISFCCFVFFK